MSLSDSPTRQPEHIAPHHRAARAVVCKSATLLSILALTTSLGACASLKPMGPVGVGSDNDNASAAQAPSPPPSQRASSDASRSSAMKPGAPVPGSEKDFVVNIGDRVFFEFNRYTLTPAGQTLLTKQAGWLKQYPKVGIRIEGNCDERGTREYNLALGARRANTVREYLTHQGIVATRINTISYGKERPFDTGTGETAWARNRNAHTALTSGVK